MYVALTLNLLKALPETASPPSHLQQLTAELDQSSREQTRLSREADSLQQRVELQGRRLQEAEGQKAALETQLSNTTGQFRHAREKATESIKRFVVCVFVGGWWVCVHASLSWLCTHLWIPPTSTYLMSFAMYVVVRTYIRICIYVRISACTTPYCVRRLKLQCRHSEEELARLRRERDELVVSLPSGFGRRRLSLGVHTCI